MNTVSLLSPAKINLYLHVVGRRPDGYHEVRTILQVVDLCDTVTLRRTDAGVTLECRGIPSPPGRANLAVRAAELLREEAEIPGGVAITLEKRIPPERGLGGGSSNAAAVLWGINLLYDLNLSPEELGDLGGRLGSDVPFFLSPGLARATGRGEVIEPLPSFSPHPVLLIFPAVTVSTPWAYGLLQLELTREDKSTTISALIRQGGETEAWNLCSNIFEEVIFSEYPQIARVKERLKNEGAWPVLMSGSGSAVYGFFRDEGDVQRAASRLRGEGYDLLVCRTVRDNPLIRGGGEKPTAPVSAQGRGWGVAKR